jgi:tetratricopeptide (TPR) repeat protein
MRRFLLRSLFCLGFASAPAFAQTGDLTPAQKQEKAIKLFEEAESYYNLQEFEKALNLYKEAYLLSQEPALLYNIAQCQRQTKRYEEAIKSYRAFLRTSQDDELRPQIEAFITEMEAILKKNGSATQPDSNPTALSDGPPIHKFLLFGAAGVGGVSAVTAVVSLLSAKSSREQQLEASTDAEAIAQSAALSQSMGLISTATFAAALGAGGAGYAMRQSKEKRPLLSSSLLYGTAAGSAALALGAGGLALFSARDAKELQAQGSQNNELVVSREAFSSQMALTADALLVLSVASGVGGFLLSKKEKTSLLLSPSSVAIQVAF